MACLVRWLAVVACVWAVTQAAVAGPVERRGVEARVVLALYDASREASADGSRIHRFADLPLSHLGLVLRYHDISRGPPDDEALRGVRGVITWFAEPVPEPIRYLGWAASAARSGVKFVVLGDLGAPSEKRYLPLINAFLESIGLRHAGDVVWPTAGVRVARLDRGLAGFECSVDPHLPSFPVVTTTRDDVSVAIGLDYDGRTLAAAAVGPGGGYAALGYEFCHQAPPLHRGRWLINPFAFFGEAFDLRQMPTPDTTTASGRRLYFSLVRGEGWGRASQIERYRSVKATAGEVVSRELFAAFPELPVSLGFRKEDFEAPAGRANASEAMAERTYGLAHVDRPGERAIGTVLSRFDVGFPSISGLAPLRSASNPDQFYAPMSDVSGFVRKDEGASIGFLGLGQTIEATETPRRLAPFNLNYHAGVGGSAALLEGVRTHLGRARAAQLTPVTSQQYAAIVEGFFAAEIERIDARRWEIRDRGAMSTFRFDHADAIDVDFAASRGVIGRSRAGGALYVALDAAVEPVRIAIRPAAEAADSPPPLSLDGSRWSVRSLRREACGVSLIAQGFGAGAFAWSGARPGRYLISAQVEGATPPPIEAIAGADGRLAFEVAASAIKPVRLVIACAAEGSG